jgi:HK97 family phage portal protein
VGWFTRAIRPPDPIPSSAGGDPSAITVEPDTPSRPATFQRLPPPPGALQPWAGWPSGWQVPIGGNLSPLTDTAWTCVDLNASVLAAMPPYLVGAADTLDASWLVNPDPLLYTSWEEFAKQLFWDFQLGEAFVLATARYSTGYPARFHVVAPWLITVDMDQGFRRYRIGSAEVTEDVLHLRYKSTTDDSRGHGPLEAGWGNVVAAQMLVQYASGLAASGGVPTSVLTHPDELSADQAAELKNQWVQARLSALGEPAVLSGGVSWEATQLDPEKMALVDLQKFAESRIAVMLGVPPFLVGLPSGGDPMTYSNVNAIFDYHWRAGLRPKASTVMAALSGWLLPRGTRVEVNRDSYVQPDPLQRAQTYQIYAGITDAQGNPVLSVEDIRRLERFDEQLGDDVGSTPMQVLAAIGGGQQ